MSIVGEICRVRIALANAARHVKLTVNGNKSGIHGGEIGPVREVCSFLPCSTATVQPKSNLIIRSGTSGKEVRGEESVALWRARCLLEYAGSKWHNGRQGVR
jgi:hypothetical protein